MSNRITFIPENKNGTGLFTLTAARLRLTKENWSLKVSCIEADGKTDREMAEIAFNLPNGKRLVLSIQTVMSIESVLRNAVEVVGNYEEEVCQDKMSLEDIEASKEELTALLNLFHDQ